MDINSEQFVTVLRSALHYLYDPDQLRRSPLAGMFDLTNRVDASFVLQKILMDAIEALQPDPSEPPQSRAWLLHDVLFYRYVRGYERQALANQLGISGRQLSRDQRSALEALAQFLWQAYRLDEKQLLQPGATTLETSQAVPAPEETGAFLSGSVESQFAPVIVEQPWIEALPADKPAPWKPILTSVLDLLHSIASQYEVKLEAAPHESLPDLLAPQNALRHSLLNLLSLLIPMAKGGQITVWPDVDNQELNLKIRAAAAEAALPEDISRVAERPSAAVAFGLIERAGGQLQINPRPGYIEAFLSLPALAQIPVLVIDDNPDIIHLFQRYAQNTRYQVVGSSNPVEFFSLLQKMKPPIIIMDLMMPDLDGWDLLSQIRQERQSSSYAIIICSILPQQDLARSLGANGFLQKPVLPQEFIQALDEHMSPLLENEK